MSEVDPWKIARWVLIVLVAGFIGQFGKMLATHILQRIRERRRESGPAGKGSLSGNGKLPAAGTGGMPALSEGNAGPQAVAGETGEDLKKIAKRRKKDSKTLLKMKKKGAGGEERKESAPMAPPRDGEAT